MLVNMKDVLQDAWKNHYAVPAFDCTEDVMIRPILDACEAKRSPVILMALGHDLRGRGMDYISSIIKGVAPKYDIPIILHLDHATDIDLIAQAITNGFTSVMYDGSMLALETNAANTRKVVKIASGQGVTVEAELGHVAGKELDGSSAGEMLLTEPEEVCRFLDDTGVDALAVSIGTAHGIYTSAPHLNIDRLKEIKQRSRVPLVLHGGSGTPEDQLRQAILNGIAKVNIYSDLRMSMMNGLKRAADSIRKPDPLPDILFRPIKEEVENAVISKINLCMSAGRA